MPSRTAQWVAVAFAIKFYEDPSAFAPLLVTATHLWSVRARSAFVR
jgi:hypothetical protein